MKVIAGDKYKGRNFGSCMVTEIKEGRVYYTLYDDEGVLDGSHSCDENNFFEGYLPNVIKEAPTDQHYNNTNGSLYKFAQDHELNAWEFDIIKRITRCRKKGQFKEDLEKTKRVIDLYLKEFEA